MTRLEKHRAGVDGHELRLPNALLESAPAEDVIAWAVKRFGRQLALACSFQDCVIVDLAVQADPGIEVVFLDTGFHFPETLAFVEKVRSLYDLNLTVVRPGPEADAWPCGSERCCELRKVAPLERALEGRLAWMTGLKRCDAPTRSCTPVAAWDEKRRMVKVNPLAAWSDDDISTYLADHGLPVHPLVPRGYLSIGCAPTTRPVDPGAQPRSGRWWGTTKTECGLHL
ncbi:MAG TPA: phosphoadenylyl-sulfate reductase [Acidimicrobiales bacterium]|nr:phosphoadenylyl-sulfate reductase [Acidimicrobiales bacterium]